MKKKIFIILTILAFVLFGSGITYSVFTSKIDGVTTDQKLAKFVFNAESLDHLELSLVDLKPSDVEEYSFSVTNSKDSISSDVTLDYQLTLTTLHIMPLTIELYKTVDNNPTLIMTCDESYTRNTANELVCNSTTQELVYSTSSVDDYTIKVTFPNTYKDSTYANLIDYIDVEIKSWQKVTE